MSCGKRNLKGAVIAILFSTHRNTLIAYARTCGIESLSKFRLSQMGFYLSNFNGQLQPHSTEGVNGSSLHVGIEISNFLFLLFFYLSLCTLNESHDDDMEDSNPVEEEEEEDSAQR